jgi:hypothetical protein
MFGAALGLPLAYAVARYPMCFADDIQFFVLSLGFLPLVAIAIPLIVIWLDVGLYDTRIALIVTYSYVEGFAKLPRLVISSSGEDVGFVGAELAAHGLSGPAALEAPYLSAGSILAQSDMVAVLGYQIAGEFRRSYPIEIKELPIKSPEGAQHHAVASPARRSAGAPLAARGCRQNRKEESVSRTALARHPKFVAR